VPLDSVSENILGVYDTGIVSIPATAGSVDVLLRHERAHRLGAPTIDASRHVLYYVDLTERKLMKQIGDAERGSELWRIPTAYLPHPHACAIWLDVSPDGETVLAAFTGGGNSPHLITISTKTGKATEVPLEGDILRKVWNRFHWKDNDSVLLRTADELMLMDLATRKLKTLLRCSPDERFALSADRRALIGIDGTFTAKLYDLRSMTLSDTFSVKEVPGASHEEFALGEKLLYLCRGGSGKSMLGLPDVGGIYALNIKSKEIYRVARGPLWISNMTCYQRLP
jgi:hypothetical protein